MEIEVRPPLSLSTEEVAAWTALQAETGLAAPFLSPHWARACASVDGPDCGHARVAVLREGGTPVGFFPARVCRNTALPVGAPLCDYQGVVASPGVEIDPRRLVRALRVSRLDLQNLLADQAPFAPYMRGEAESQVVSLRDGFDAYAAERRAAGTDILQDAAKKRRKLEREHGEAQFLALSSSAEDFDRLVAWKRAQYAATGQTDIFEAPWTLALLGKLRQQADPAFGGALFSLHVGGKLVAAHFALRAGEVLHAWFIAHDDAFGRYSPGVILIVEILKWASEQGFAELDLGPGDYRFKQSLANVKRKVAHGFVGRPSPATLARAVAYRVRDTAEALPLGRMSQLPGKAMRRLDLIRGLR